MISAICRGPVALGIACTLAAWHSPAHAASATECAKIGTCYCVNDELKPAISAKIDRFRQVIAEQRKAGKIVATSAFRSRQLVAATSM